MGFFDYLRKMLGWLSSTAEAEMPGVTVTVIGRASNTASINGRADNAASITGRADNTVSVTGSI